MRKHLAEGHRAAARQPAGRWLVKLVFVVAPIALLGEVGHEVLDRLGQVLAHHSFHILFLGGAVMAFAAYALVDIRRHGRPSFSWRLRQPRTPTSDPTRAALNARGGRMTRRASTDRRPSGI